MHKNKIYFIKQETWVDKVVVLAVIITTPVEAQAVATWVVVTEDIKS